TRSMSGIALTALVQLPERAQALAPPPLHPRRRIRVRQARVLDRYSAPRLTPGLERGVDAGPAVAPVEASRPGLRRAALTQLRVREPTTTLRFACERAEEPAGRYSHCLRCRDREPVRALADGAPAPGPLVADGHRL